jgi:tRNA threonylcarbamoyladenosine biosynthesis protein TsaB
MNILAIDSTSISASVAVMTEETLLGEYTVNHPRTHSQKLMPIIQSLLGELEMRVDEMDLIAVSNGPGSFTGIRIGLATAKGLSQPFGIPVIEVPTLVALAFNYYGFAGLVCPVMDARRDEVYTGLYRFEAGKLVEMIGECAIHPLKLAESISGLNEKGENVMFLGDGCYKYREIFEDVLGKNAIFSPGGGVMQKASSVGAAAVLMGYDKKSYLDIDANYLRKSEAEETRERKSGI